MEMEGVMQATGSPAVPPQHHHHHQRPQTDLEAQHQQQQQPPADRPSPGATAVRAPVSPAVVAAPAAAGHHQTANGVAPSSHQQSASPGTRSGTPLSHPSTPRVVNGHPPLPPLPPNVDATLSAEASAAVNAVTSANNAARAKDHLRWRDPMTVKYDGIGQAQPGKLQAQQTPTQTLPSPQPPLPPPPQHQLQHQYPLQTPLSQQQHQHPQPHQHQDPLPSLTHPIHQHPHHHQQPLPPHHHHHTPTALPPRQPPLTSYSSQPAPPPPPVPLQPASLPPLHHPPPPASSHPLPPVIPLPAQAHNPISKPIIMDPPGRRASQPSSPQKGFPSPSLDHARVNPKFVDDCTRMTFAVQQSLPEAVRRIIRDNWEKCLLGSEFHQAFILNASIHHASTSITRRAVRDFGATMVKDSREEVIGHLNSQDLDAVVDQILAKASDTFLDRCLEKRLLTIEAKPLINALAKAERLGYDPTDIVQEDHHERVIPREAFPGAGAAITTGYPQQQQQQPRPTQPPPTFSPSNPQLQCMRCFRTFQQSSPFEYHTRFNVCSAAPPSSEGFKHSCAPCGQQFVSGDELQSHVENRVCTNFGSKSSRGPGRPPRTAPVAQPNPVAILPSMSMQSPNTNGYQPSQTQVQSTPTPSQPPARRSTGAATSTGTPGGSPNPDPYAHLSKAELDAMNEELHAAEAKYAPRFKEAEQIPDENERRSRIEGLRNSFGTKQSMIRKKYGVRLRERRTKAEIQAEKERLGIKRAEREKARAALNATPVNSSPAVHTEPSPIRPAVGSGWTAANTPRASNAWEEHDAKRRRLDGTGEFQTSYKSAADETPTRKTLSVAEMGGGLPGSTATAATHDPTLPPPSQPFKVFEQPGAQEQIPQPAQQTASMRESTSERPSPVSSGTPNRDSRESTDLPPGKLPVPIDDSGSSDDDDEGIPPSLPPHIRQSLTPQKPASSTVASS